MNDDYGTWFAVVVDYGESPLEREIVIYDTEPKAKREVAMFGGRVIEVRTHTMSCQSSEDWKRSIARSVRCLLEKDPKNNGPIDLR